MDSSSNSRQETLIDSIDQLLEKDRLFTSAASQTPTDQLILKQLKHLSKDISHINDRFKKAEYLQGKTIDDLGDLKQTIHGLEQQVVDLGGKIEEDRVIFEGASKIDSCKCVIF